MGAEKRLKELNLQLGAVSPPVANYVNAVRAGNLLFLAGKGGRAGADGRRPQGKIGREYTVEQGYQQARDTGVELLSVMRHELGSLDRVKRIVKVLGMVNAVPEFQDHPKVINGCSDLFVEVFGDKGRHARSAVGMGSLPMQIPVEIECIVEVAADARARRSGTTPRRKPAARSAARARRRARR
jgi:enamine deaminase RidA (YjgF/YER057c/UK114 family)